MNVLNRSGFRKAEWAARQAGGKTALTFRQIAYCFDDSDQPIRRPPAATLRTRHAVVWLYLYPVPSKCDPDGSKFCTKAIPFKMEPGDETVLLFIEEELRMHEQGLTDEQRAQEPLFTSAPGVAFHRSAIDDALREALLLFVTLAIAAHLSWHSYRVRLACKLKAARCDNPTIQALVRWNTDQAIAIYARYEREEYWALLQRAEAQDATSVQFTALPEIDEMQRVLARLGVADKSAAEIEAAVNAVVNGGTGVLSSIQPPPPRPAASRGTPAQSKVPAGLPVGWHRCDSTTQSGRSIPTYHGPESATARSRLEAWRLYGAQLQGQASTSSSGVPPGPSGLARRDARGKKPTCDAPSAADDSGGPSGPSVARSHGSEPEAPSVALHPLRIKGSSSPSRGYRAKPTRTAPTAADPRGNPARPSRPAFPSDTFELAEGVCGTFGCGLRDGHAGLCSTMLLSQSRKRSVSYAGMD